MNSRTFIVTCGLTVCLLALPVVAGTLEDGKAAYDRKDYATAFKLLQPIAQKGDVKAQGALGMMYTLGHGVPQDYKEALKWFERAANQGDPLSQARIGLMYNDGEGVPQDYVEAVKWYSLAAEQGFYLAQFRLGAMYARGQGVLKNLVLAHMWINLAAADVKNSTGDQRQSLVAVRADLEKMMSPKEVVEAQKLAREWLAAHPRP